MSTTRDAKEEVEDVNEEIPAGTDLVSSTSDPDQLRTSGEDAIDVLGMGPFIMSEIFQSTVPVVDIVSAWIQGRNLKRQHIVEKRNEKSGLVASPIGRPQSCRASPCRTLRRNAFTFRRGRKA